MGRSLAPRSSARACGYASIVSASRSGRCATTNSSRSCPARLGFKRITALVRSYVGDELKWDLRLMVAEDAIRPARLGSDAQLGRTSWLVAHSKRTSRPRRSDRRPGPRLRTQGRQRAAGEGLTCQRSAASHCSESSIRSRTKRSRARPCFARCAAIPMSSWRTGCISCWSSRTATSSALSAHFALDPSRLSKDLTEALDRLPRGSTSISDLSSHVEDASSAPGSTAP